MAKPFFGARPSIAARANLIALIAILAAQLAIATPSATATSHRATERSSIAALAELVERRGLDAELPPNLSRVLGIGSGRPVAVKQAVMRHGSEVRVFNVSVATPADLVILRTDEERGTTRAYLLTRSGTLRKAVYFHAGAEPETPPAAVARAAFAREVRYWTHLGGRARVLSPRATH